VAVAVVSSVHAEAARILTVGLGADVALDHAQHEAYASVADLPRGLAFAVDRTTFELRARSTGGDKWDPTVVLVSACAAGQEHAPALVGPGVCAVAGWPPDGEAPVGAAVLSPHGARWRLTKDLLRLDLQPLGLTPDDVAGLADLVHVPSTAGELTAPGAGSVASDPPDRPLQAVCARNPIAVVDDPDPAPLTIPAPVSTVSAEPASAESASDAPADGEASPWTLLVRLLGPVDVVDAAGQPVRFDRSKALELVVWLATHRRRPTRRGARTALWDADVRDATFANVVSDARRAMARLVTPPSGEEWIGRTLTEDLPLHERVVTDVDIVEAARRRAEHLEPEAARRELGAALELVRGAPFEGTAYLWPDGEGFASWCVLTALGAAADLARLHLELGDVDGVLRATAVGLQVLPGHEELIALRMRAHASAGDRAGLRQEWESYQRALLADPWSDGEPAPELVALRDALRRTAAA
jgi:hypothetical protein